MICMYFGKPRSGKSTFACHIAKKELKNGKRVFSNFPIKGATLISNDDLGKYGFDNSVVIIDEAGIDFNNRNFTDYYYRKSFAPILEWLKLHGHYKCDVHVISQSADDVDITFRRLADRLYYIKNFCHYFTMVFGISKILDIKDNQINDGYALKPIPKIVYNPPLWAMFDSWHLDKRLPPFPSL